MTKQTVKRERQEARWKELEVRDEQATLQRLLEKYKP